MAAVALTTTTSVTTHGVLNTVQLKAQSSDIAEESNTSLLECQSVSVKTSVAGNSLVPKPVTTERLALVLDLDECLVHSVFDRKNNYRQMENRPTNLRRYEDSVQVTLSNGEHVQVNKRPGLDAFLEKVTKQFDIYVFTAGSRGYASPVIDAIDPTGKIFKGRFFRDDCYHKRGTFLKDLRVVRQDLSRVILVDNNPFSFLLQPSNGIPVPSFFDDCEDDSLEKVFELVSRIEAVDDVRPQLHSLFNLKTLLAQHRRAL